MLILGLAILVAAAAVLVVRYVNLVDVGPFVVDPLNFVNLFLLVSNPFELLLAARRVLTSKVVCHLMVRVTGADVGSLLLLNIGVLMSSSTSGELALCTSSFFLHSLRLTVAVGVSAYVAACVDVYVYGCVCGCILIVCGCVCACILICIHTCIRIAFLTFSLGSNNYLVLLVLKCPRVRGVNRTL
jgi:hypothetical protein